MITREFLENRSAYRYPSDTVVAALESDTRTGLSTEEAQTRLQRYGRNELPSLPPPPAWHRFLAQFWNPLTVLLLVATIISFVVWWIEQDSVFPYESFTIFAIVLLNGILGYVQEHRAERAVAALQAMTAATARVLRDGYVQTIPTSEVVPGDILIIEEGDTIPEVLTLLALLQYRRGADHVLRRHPGQHHRAGWRGRHSHRRAAALNTDPVDQSVDRCRAGAGSGR